jgi:hypothetical protein
MINAKTHTGRAMSLTFCSPISSNESGSLSQIWSRTTREMQIPPSSANASRRCDINAVAVDVIGFSDHVARVDPDAELDWSSGRVTALRRAIPCWTLSPIKQRDFALSSASPRPMSDLISLTHTLESTVDRRAPNNSIPL